MNFIEEKILENGNLDNLKLRFPPEPNFGLHIGHAKSICLNFGIAEKYNRPCNLRFDDTNPSSEKSEFVDSIIGDIKWLGFTPSEILYTSDYFDRIYEYAVILIRKGLAYVDESTSEEIALLKGSPTIPGRDSVYKSRSIEENLSLFHKMKSGEFKEGSMILRANIDMSSPNMILRDPILYRIVSDSHHRTKNKWNIYPMYDFGHPLSDYIEGITDSLCTLEFEVHRPLYMWILENCTDGVNLPEETEFARLNIDYSVMSKRKFKHLSENGIVDGFDDPRLLTLSGLRRRGYTPKSIRDFCEKVGVTKRESVVSYKLLEECLRDDLNKSANRMMGVFDPVKVIITNWEGGTEYLEIENNPEDPSAGSRMVPFGKEIWIEREDFKIEADNKFHRLKLGGEVRLKGAYIIKANDIILDENGEISEILCTYDFNTKSGMIVDRKVKGTIHWVSVRHGVKMNVNEYESLFTDPNPDDLDDFISCINPNSLSVNKNAIFEEYIMNIPTGMSVQMMRKGYYCLDIDGVSLNRTVSLKESYK
jgi:glutaminyl-tRNA synthetase